MLWKVYSVTKLCWFWVSALAWMRSSCWLKTLTTSLRMLLIDPERSTTNPIWLTS